MNADIIEFIGFEPHWETDHTETAMAKVVGTANYRVRYPDGLEEELLTGIRPGENNAWNIKVIAAAQAWLDAGASYLNGCRPLPMKSAPQCPRLPQGKLGSACFTAEQLRTMLRPLSRRLAIRQNGLLLISSGARPTHLSGHIRLSRNWVQPWDIRRK